MQNCLNGKSQNETGISSTYYSTKE